MSRPIAPDPALAYLGFAPLGPLATLPVEGSGKWRFDWKTAPLEARFGAKWAAPPPMEQTQKAFWSSFAADFCACGAGGGNSQPLVCAGARARGQCLLSSIASISFILLEARADKKLNKLRFCALCEVEQTRSSPARMEHQPARMERRPAPMEANRQLGCVEGRGEVESLQGWVLANHRPSHSQVFSWWADFSACWYVGQSVEAPQIAHNRFQFSQAEFRPARRRVRSGASAGTRAHARVGVCDHA